MKCPFINRQRATKATNQHTNLHATSIQYVARQGRAECCATARSKRRTGRRQGNWHETQPRSPEETNCAYIFIDAVPINRAVHCRWESFVEPTATGAGGACPRVSSNHFGCCACVPWSVGPCCPCRPAGHRAAWCSSSSAPPALFGNVGSRLACFN